MSDRYPTGIVKPASNIRELLAWPVAHVSIDVQNAYCSPRGRVASMGYDMSWADPVATTIAEFTAQSRELLDSTVFVRTEHPEWRSPALSRQFDRTTLGSFAAWDGLYDWYGDVRPGPQDEVITKTRYSAFVGTTLAAHLRAKRVETIIVTGVTTDVCVDSSVRDAFFQDFSVIVLADGTGGSTPERHENALEILDLYFATVSDSQSVLAELRAKRGGA
ncbi:MAG TPA: isochorismatase family cysteine hydrolase [Microbacteriaceae bacterium]|nr:isochorismatase family cysteine hydrolase [Microbacteriaceae bacterium]